MEAEEQVLAREYVQEFVLDHLDATADVKREAATHQHLDKVKPLLTALVRSNPDSNAKLMHTLPVESSQQLRPALGPLTPPQHELEQPLYGQPQHGVLVKLPYATGLTGLQHPGTPPDTPPVSASPPAIQHLQRLERLERMHHHPHQPQQHPQPDVILPDGMPWLTQSLRQEPLDLRPHCPQEGSESELDGEHWPAHHLPDLVQHHHHNHHPASHAPPRHLRHTGAFFSFFVHLLFLLFEERK